MRILPQLTASGLVLVLGLLLASPALAYRPLTTDDAGVAEPGHGGVEVGLSGIRPGPGYSQGQLLVTPTLGVLPNLEIGVDVPLVLARDRVTTQGGLGDVVLNAKYALKLWTDPLLPAISFKAAVKGATGSGRRGLGDERLAADLVAITSYGLGPVTVHGNLGYRVKEGGGRGSDFLFYAAAGDVGLLPGLSLVGEITGERHVNAAQIRNPLGLTVGLVLHFTEYLALDAGIKKGLNNGSEDYSGTCGVTVDF